MWIPSCLGHMCTLWGERSALSGTTLTHLTSSVRRFGTEVPHWPLKDILLGKALFLSSERESCNQKKKKNYTETCLGKEKWKIYQRILLLALSEPPHYVVPHSNF